MNKKIQKVIRLENDLEKHINNAGIKDLELLERLLMQFKKLEDNLNLLIGLIENKLERSE